jgi:predicted ATPase
MLKRLYIKNLFGVEKNDKDIKFNSDITILVGRNGAGKTTILNILNIILSKQFRKLTSYKFSEIQLEADEGILRIYWRIDNVLIVERTDLEQTSLFSLNQYQHIQTMIQSLKFNPTFPSDLSCNHPYHSIYSNRQNDIALYSLIQKVYIAITKEQPFNKKNTLNSSNEVFQDFEFNIPTNYFPTYRRFEIDLNNLFPNSLNYEFQNNKFPIMPSEYDSELRPCNNIVFACNNSDINRIIKTNWTKMTFYERKVLDSLVNEFISIFLEIPEEHTINNTNISDINCETLEIELKEAFSRIGVFTKINPKINIPNKKAFVLLAKIDTLIENIKWAQNFIRKYNANSCSTEQKYDLSDWGRYTNIMSICPKINKILTLYRDTCNKIEQNQKPLHDLEEILSEFLNMTVQIKNSIIFKKNNKLLNFEDLSAGEKQLISLFIYIFFQKKKVILIDEPELSLHVSWQRKFIDKIYNAKMQFIMTTHTPFIISNYGNKVVKVGEFDEF